MDERLVGRTPPKEYQFKPGESGNPNGQPTHRTNLWTYFTKYMAMTADERDKVDRTKLTAAQETALKMVEKAILGKGCGFERLARYIVDREEGKAAEHLILDHDAQDRYELEKHGIKTTAAKKDVHLGIEAVQTVLQVQADGRPRLQIFSTCTHTIAEMIGYRWAKGTEIKDPRAASLGRARARALAL